MIRSPPELFETIHCVISLDDLLLDFCSCTVIPRSSDRLVLRIAKHAARADLQGLYDAFADVAEQMGVSLMIESRTVNIMDEHRMLPHERFALRRLAAATLTSAPIGTNLHRFATSRKFALSRWLGFFRAVERNAALSAHPARRRGSGSLHVWRSRCRPSDFRGDFVNRYFRGDWKRIQCT